MDLVRNALERGQSALTEYEAKRFLSARGIPVAREALAKNPAAAVREGGELHIADFADLPIRNSCLW
jgi:hypothetical protein